jgi:hypothetical protein
MRKAHFVTYIHRLWNKAQLQFLLTSELHEHAPDTEMLQILFNRRIMWTEGGHHLNVIVMKT